MPYTVSTGSHLAVAAVNTLSFERTEVVEVTEQSPATEQKTFNGKVVIHIISTTLTRAVFVRSIGSKYWVINFQ